MSLASLEVHLTNQELYGSLPRITIIVRQRRLRLAGHVIVAKQSPAVMK